MKNFLLTGVASLLIVSCTPSPKSAPAPEAPSPAAPAPGATAKALVIDVRTPQEYQAGHIEGAINVPIDNLQQQIGTVASNKDTPLQVHCQGGRRSARAASQLKSLGYTQVEDLGSLAHAREVLAGK